MRPTSKRCQMHRPIRFRFSKRALCGTEPESPRVVKKRQFSSGAALRAHCPYIAEALEQNFFPRISKIGCSAPQLPDGLANRGQLSLRRYIPLCPDLSFR